MSSLIEEELKMYAKRFKPSVSEEEVDRFVSDCIEIIEKGIKEEIEKVIEELIEKRKKESAGAPDWYKIYHDESGEK